MPEPAPKRSRVVVSSAWVLGVVLLGAALMAWALYHIVKTPAF